MSESLLKIVNLKKHFPVRKGIFSSVKSFVRAVDDISFEIEPGKTLGLVGESGSGKTTVGRIILKLMEATDGEVYFKDREVFGLEKENLRLFRKQAQIVFQDPYSSLNPRMTVGGMLREAIKLHHPLKKKEIEDKAGEILGLVGLQREHLNRYPHEFSGGQRQRISIARVLAVQPEFIVADEPVSALDVSIQAQIVNLLQELQEQFKLTYLFIAHDLSVVRHISDEIAVMYLGKIVEKASTRELFSNPLHPYTQVLLSSVPVPDPCRRKQKERIKPKSEDCNSYHLTNCGCRFYNRCPKAMDECLEKEPEVKNQGDKHTVACHLYS